MEAQPKEGVSAPGHTGHIGHSSKPSKPADHDGWKASPDVSRRPRSPSLSALGSRLCASVGQETLGHATAVLLILVLGRTSYTCAWSSLQKHGNHGNDEASPVKENWDATSKKASSPSASNTRPRPAGGVPQGSQASPMRGSTDLAGAYTGGVPGDEAKTPHAALTTGDKAEKM